MNHIMIDIETLDTIYSAKILSIGAVYFDPMKNKLGSEFFEIVNSQRQLDRTSSKDTIEFWRKQSREAKKQLKGDVQLRDALEDLDLFIDPDCRVWGNGATFDITILEHAYLSFDMSIPWKFWNVRDCRTVRELFESKRGGLDQNFNGTKHHALDDAKYQAKYISKMWRGLIK